MVFLLYLEIWALDVLVDFFEIVSVY